MLISVLFLIMSATSWKVRGSNAGGGEIFRTRPDRPWGSHRLLYNKYWVSFPGVKRQGCGVDVPPQSSTEVKEIIELYVFYLSGHSWPFLGGAAPVSLCLCQMALIFRQLLHVHTFRILRLSFYGNICPGVLRLVIPNLKESSGRTLERGAESRGLLWRPKFSWEQLRK